LTEAPSYAYYEFPERVSDRLSYGENHPERRAFYKVLDGVRNKGRELKRLHEVVEFIEEDVEPDKEYPDEPVTYLGLEDIEPNTGKAWFKTMLGREILSTSKRIYRGNIVFAGLRPYLNKAHLVKIEKALGSAELFVVQPKESLVLPKFLLKYLLSDLTLTQTKWILTGCSYPRLNVEDFKQLLVIRPEKEEQKEILRKIEPLEREMERGGVETVKLVNECRNLILTKLGIKMPSPPTFSPTIRDYFTRWVDENSERLDFVYHHPWMDKIRSLLDSLKTVKLEEVIEPHIDYGITASGRETGVFPFINIENLEPDGRLNTSDIKYIDDAEENELVRPMDILLSRSRLVGVCGIVREKEDGFSFGSYILRMKIRKGVQIPAEYIVSFLNSDLGQAQIRMLETGSFGKNINTRQVKEILIPLPDRKDNVSRIANELRKKWGELDTLEKQVEMLWSNSRKQFSELLLTKMIARNRRPSHVG